MSKTRIDNLTVKLGHLGFVVNQSNVSLIGAEFKSNCPKCKEESIIKSEDYLLDYSIMSGVSTLCEPTFSCDCGEVWSIEFNLSPSINIYVY